MASAAQKETHIDVRDSRLGVSIAGAIAALAMVAGLGYAYSLDQGETDREIASLAQSVQSLAQSVESISNRLEARTGARWTRTDALLHCMATQLAGGPACVHPDMSRYRPQLVQQ